MSPSVLTCVYAVYWQVLMLKRLDPMFDNIPR